MRRRPARVVLLLALLALAGPGGVAADGPTVGNIVVHADHVLPGGTFLLTGTDLDESATVTVRLTSGESAAQLGTVHTAADGSLSADLVVPASFPNGYAELAASSVGTTWTTIMLVGERAEGPGAQPSPGEDASDASLLTIAAALVLLAIAGAGLVMFRRSGRRAA